MFDTQSRTRSVEGFASEAELVAFLIKHIGTVIEFGDAATATEVPIGAGFVDLVLASRPAKVPPALAALCDTDAAVLSALYVRRRLRVSTISSRCNLSLKETEASLERLSYSDFVTKFGGTFVRNSILDRGLISIEGKLRDWRGALRQASRNRLFSHRSFVALDAKHAKPIRDNLALFSERQVGVMLVDKNNGINILFNPKNTSPIGKVMTVRAEFAFLRCLDA